MKYFMLALIMTLLTPAFGNTDNGYDDLWKKVRKEMEKTCQDQLMIW